MNSYPASPSAMPIPNPNPCAADVADAQTRRRLDALSRLIGNTPMIAVELLFRGRPRTVYAKAEYLNYTGSIKDRMALHILTQAYQSGRTQPGDRIAEATRGNTGISFAALGQALGHPVTIFMPDWMSQERVALLRPTCELPHEPSPGFDQPRGLSRAA